VPAVIIVLRIRLLHQVEAGPRAFVTGAYGQFSLEPKEASVNTTDFATMSDQELRDRARTAGVLGASDLPREELIATLRDGAMTRSEERLVVGTDVVEIGRARLRKHVVTEQVQMTVTVRREELRLEREPVPAHQQSLVTDPDVFGTDEGFVTPDGGVIFEVTLHEERPVVTTEIVPVERVRLRKVVETDSQTVSGEVRKERIEVEVPGQAPTTVD
jgi:stress response protein YsnF